MKQYSFKLNILLNTIRNIVVIVTPLITFPYVTRVLGVDNIGRITFANSIIAYFIMIADLGIKMYAIGHGPAIRDNKMELSSFSNSLFTINIISTIVSYLLLIFVIYFTPQLKDYILLLSILSLQVFLSTIGVEWIFVVFEDFLFITIRTVVINVITILLLFFFVRSTDDLIIYAILTVVSAGGVNLTNFLYSRKYLELKITCDLNWKKHIKPILLLFATQAAIVIYVSSDTTILGFLCGPVVVGIYAVAAKLYTVIKAIIASIIGAVIPRMSNIYGTHNNKDFSKMGDEAYSIMTTLAVPLIIGTIVLAPEIVYLLAGADYMEAITPIRILSVSLFFCVGAYFWGQAVLVPVGKEKVLFHATLISGVLNIVLNFAFIPIWSFNAAALTTLLSEMFTFFYCKHLCRGLIQLKNEYSILLKSLIGGFVIIAAYIFLNMFDFPIILYLLLMVILSAFLYVFAGLLLKNEVIVTMVFRLKSFVTSMIPSRIDGQ